MEPMTFLDGISGYVRTSTDGSADKGIRLAVIDPAYDPFDPPYPDGIPLPRVTFEGEATLSGKHYAVASGYVPQPGARVYMVPIGKTWLIAGAVTHYSAQGFYADPAAGTVGVEFGDGSYYDIDSGLVILGDGDFRGDLSIGGIGKSVDVIKTGNTSRANNTMADDPTLFADLDIGTWFVDFDIIWGGVTGDLKTAWNVTGTTASYSLKTCLGPGPGVELQSRDNTQMRHSVHQYGTEITYGANSNTLYYGLKEYGLIRFTTAGRVAFRWAQETTDATASIVVGGSTLRARRIA